MKSRVLDFLVRFLATGFFSGFSPVAPGTAGTLVGAVLFLFCLLFQPVLIFYGTLAILVIVGIPVSSAMEARLSEKDPGAVVIDEMAGFFTAMSLFPLFPRWSASFWLYAALGFALFRLLDILKPFPIGQIQALPGGWGIMADDLVAGVLAAAGAWAVCSFLIII